MTTKPTPPYALEDRDVIEHAAGLAEGDKLQRLRRRRGSVVDHAQATVLALIAPGEPGNLSLVERAALALRVALVNEEHGLAAWYRDRLAEAGASAALIDAIRDRPLATGAPATGTAEQSVPGRLAVMLDHVDHVAVEPGGVGPAHISALEAAGLGEPEIVTVSQIAAFVSYQARVTAGLREIAALR
jgi:CMD domain protein